MLRVTSILWPIGTHKSASKNWSHLTLRQNQTDNPMVNFKDYLIIAYCTSVSSALPPNLKWFCRFAISLFYYALYQFDEARETIYNKNVIVPQWQYRNRIIKMRRMAGARIITRICLILCGLEAYKGHFSYHCIDMLCCLMAILYNKIISVMYSLSRF